MKSRLMAQMAREEARQEAQRKAADVVDALAEAGDALELAARAALGAWEARKRLDMSEFGIDDDSFEFGYRTAAGELALILRAMRRGAPPDPKELEAVFKDLYEESL